MVLGQKILKGCIIFFAFLLMAGVAFWGMQWFSDSLQNLLIKKNFFSASLQNSIDNVSANVQNQAVSTNITPLRNWDVLELPVNAQAAIAVEVSNNSSKILFNKNQDRKLPVASLTKLMTALLVLKHYDLSQRVTIDESDMAQEGVQGVLELGQTLSVKNLLYLSLIESSNRAAHALARVVGNDTFVALMNNQASMMGLTNTHFQDATGLNPGSYSTAKDIATLAEYLFSEYPLFREIVGLREYSMYLENGTFHHTLQTTNKLLGQNNIIGGKTGFTNEALGCFMVVQQNSQGSDNIIYVVLGTENRFEVMTNLMDWVHNAYQW